MIRKYQSSNFSVLREIFILNTPAFFDKQEQPQFEGYFKKPELVYFTVITEDGEIIGGGGIGFDLEKVEAHLLWELIHPKYQKQGYGKGLVQHSIAHVKDNTTYKTIRANATAKNYKFYQKMGFKLLKKTKDHYGPGVDMYAMQMAL